MIIGRKVVFLEETTSTNDIAAQWGREGVAEGAVVFAERQTAGRGRMGRRWESEGGLCFSVLLRPAAANWTRLTTWAGVAIARGIESVLPGCRAGLKWPNDIWLNGKKTAGILCESEPGANGWVVVGIGINVNAVPEAFRDQATSLRDSVTRSVFGVRRFCAALDHQAVATALLRAMDASYKEDFSQIIAEAETRSVLINRSVTIHTPTETYQAIAEGLEPDGSLRVRREGEVRIISSGEVSVTPSPSPHPPSTSAR